MLRSPIAYAHVFKYSERDGTAAARFADKVSPEIQSRRSARVRKLSAEKTQRFNARYLGQTVEALFEQQQKGYWSGYTDNYIRVAVASDAILENTVQKVSIEESRGELLIGTCAGERLSGALV